MSATKPENLPSTTSGYGNLDAAPAAFSPAEHAGGGSRPPIGDGTGRVEPYAEPKPYVWGYDDDEERIRAQAHIEEQWDESDKDLDSFIETIQTQVTFPSPRAARQVVEAMYDRRNVAAEAQGKYDDAQNKLRGG